MAEVNVKERSKDAPQPQRRSGESQPTVARTDLWGRGGGADFPLLFSLNPRVSRRTDMLEGLWWVSAPRTR
jgi:hypothetical protein